MRVRTAPSPLHGRDGVFKHAVKGAAPARMGRANDACFCVGKQHRPAICGQNADHQPGRAGDNGVRFRTAGGIVRGCDMDIGRVHLVGAP
jgi:hypothetical protein